MAVPDELTRAGLHQKHLRALDEILQALQEAQDAEDSRQKLSRDERVTGSIVGKEHQIWLEILMFLNHDWFHRIWTFQEIYLARSAVILAENGVLRWGVFQTIRSLVHSIAGLGIVYSPWSANKASNGGDDIYWSGFDIQDSSKLGKRHSSFHDLLCSLGLRRARLKRDFIYGILGAVDESIRAKIHVDYTESTSCADVYSKAVILALENDNDARTSMGGSALMTFWMTGERTVPGLPSWCPVFSTPGLFPTSSTFHRGSHAIHFMVHGDSCDQWVPQNALEFLHETNAMRILALKLDTVDTVIHPTGLLKDWLLDRTMSAQEVDSLFLTLFGSQQQKWCQAMEGLFPVSTLISSEQTQPPRFISSFFCDRSGEALKKIQDAYPTLRKLSNLVTLHSITTHEEACELSGMSPQTLGQLIRDMWSFLASQVGRYVFRTSSGRLGYMPLAVSPGALLCYIPGAHYLHVFSADGTEQITMAYVEGFMGTALADILPKKMDEWEWYHLR